MPLDEMAELHHWHRPEPPDTGDRATRDVRHRRLIQAPQLSRKPGAIYEIEQELGWPARSDGKVLITGETGVGKRRGSSVDGADPPKVARSPTQTSAAGARSCLRKNLPSLTSPVPSHDATAMPYPFAENSVRKGRLAAECLLFSVYWGDTRTKGCLVTKIRSDRTPNDTNEKKTMAKIGKVGLAEALNAS